MSNISYRGVTVVTPMGRGSTVAVAMAVALAVALAVAVAVALAVAVAEVRGDMLVIRSLAKQVRWIMCHHLRISILWAIVQHYGMLIIWMINLTFH